MSQIEVDKIIPQSGTSTQLGESGDTITIPAGATITNNGTANGFGSADTEKVKVSTNDTTAGFLNGKLVAGTNISLTEGNDGGNETLTAALTGTIATAQIADDAVTLAKMAPGTDGNIISYDASGNPVAVATGSAGQVLTSAGAGAPPTFAAAGGITMADQWRLSASASGLSGASNKISSNWERTDTDGYGTIGSAMTESSGEFSFPATGIYLIMYKLNGKSTTTGNNRYANGNLYTSTDGGSSVDIAARGAGSGSGNLWDFESTAIFIFDVTNTSTHKVQFGYEFEASTQIYGNTNDSQTCVTFIRLGDT